MRVAEDRAREALRQVEEQRLLAGAGAGPEEAQQVASVLNARHAMEVANARRRHEQERQRATAKHAVDMAAQHRGLVQQAEAQLVERVAGLQAEVEAARAECEERVAAALVASAAAQSRCDAEVAAVTSACRDAEARCGEAADKRVRAIETLATARAAAVAADQEDRAAEASRQAQRAAAAVESERARCARLRDEIDAAGDRMRALEAEKAMLQRQLAARNPASVTNTGAGTRTVTGTPTEGHVAAAGAALAAVMSSQAEVERVIAARLTGEMHMATEVHALVQVLGTALKQLERHRETSGASGPARQAAATGVGDKAADARTTAPHVVGAGNDADAGPVPPLGSPPPSPPAAQSVHVAARSYPLLTRLQRLSVDHLQQLTATLNSAADAAARASRPEAGSVGATVTVALAAAQDAAAEGAPGQPPVPSQLTVSVGDDEAGGNRAWTESPLHRPRILALSRRLTVRYRQVASSVDQLLAVPAFQGMGVAHAHSGRSAPDAASAAVPWQALFAQAQPQHSPDRAASGHVRGQPLHGHFSRDAAPMAYDGAGGGAWARHHAGTSAPSAQFTTPPPRFNAPRAYGGAQWQGAASAPHYGRVGAVTLRDVRGVGMDDPLLATPDHASPVPRPAYAMSQPQSPPTPFTDTTPQQPRSGAGNRGESLSGPDTGVRARLGPDGASGDVYGSAGDHQPPASTGHPSDSMTHSDPSGARRSTAAAPGTGTSGHAAPEPSPAAARAFRRPPLTSLRQPSFVGRADVW